MVSSSRFFFAFWFSWTWFSFTCNFDLFLHFVSRVDFIVLSCNQIAQIVGKPDLAPAAWVKRLVTLCDHAPATSFHTVKLVLENELGQGIDEVFDRFDAEPLGSASIAQVFFEIVFHLLSLCLCVYASCYYVFCEKVNSQLATTLHIMVGDTS